ncbi:MAG: hypothetical protein A2X87_00395 [Deltaproteobacteria bacterium GWC2_42_51]|nr:MAG: hypothetical protein A2067_05045 [Deltaproteobacteria bacterium GWB2_42_7]OGP36438.1 MAG: hypothetical protein A2X87_00395 [Deltaproteobacteria bacterium GWC2_42_51]OGQ29437.1 MAG: hypothetical protein A3D29_01725 [Deltaproteobacteria bacterium RIFCSPHIGHO2_02_FULL_42_44]OGQ36068.1 MAG: hypothetical protein A3H47_03535 [Deltaproteobacteria bacterium RIFCSPLOWO2_02_FULL_42_39]OGQ66656.1 MAG: hypothetical protein A3F88_07435 [Deltaproteobacteria bacterium RIFCSPLOWO2_12_FULL_42_16]OGQ762
MRGAIIVQTNLYQLIISRLDGEKVSSLPYQEKVFELVRKGIAGFILFGGEKEEVKSFIDKLQAISEVPLFIASDIERGVGQQVKGYTEFPCQMAVRAAIRKDSQKDVSLLHDIIQAIALEAIDVGINMPLIPVLDVNQRPDNPIICTRAFSDNPEDVSWFGSAYIKVLEGSGLISCAKHFPGHGDTSIDSHIALPVISKSYKDLMNVDIMPFQEAVKAGVSSIMTGHLLVPAIDSMPATLSEKMIKGILRDKLGLGFDSLVITDALNMAALSGIDNLHAKCLKAGVDVLLHPADADAAVKELENSLKTKEIDEACIDRAIKRIRKVKSRLPHIRNDVGERLVPSRLDYHLHKTFSIQVTDASITLVKGTGMLSITDAHVVLAGETKFHKLSLWKSHFRNVSNISENSPSPLSSPLLGEEVNKSPLPSGERDRVRGFPDEVTIIAIFSEISAWRGSSGIGDKERQKIHELMGRTEKSIIISFGSPYILSHFKDADMLIAAYGSSEQVQRAVIKGLKGETEFRGELPVKLNFN